MTSHIQFPNIETNTLTDLNGQKILRPATLSKTILQDLLRKELNFKGVIVSDDLDMDAISKRFDVKEAVIEAWIAGVDIAILTKRFQNKASLKDWEALLTRAEQAVKQGRYPIEDLTASYERIQALKQKKLPKDDLDVSLYTSEEKSKEIDSKALSSLKMKGDASILKELPKEKSQWFSRNFFQAARQRGYLIFNGSSFAIPPDVVLVYNYSSASPKKSETDKLQATINKAKAEGKRVILLSCGVPVEEKLFPNVDLLIMSKGGLSGISSLFSR